MERKDVKTKNKGQKKGKTLHLGFEVYKYAKNGDKNVCPFWFLNQGFNKKNRNYVPRIEKIEEVSVQTHMYFPVFEY